MAVVSNDQSRRSVDGTVECVSSLYRCWSQHGQRVCSAVQCSGLHQRIVSLRLPAGQLRDSSSQFLLRSLSTRVAPCHRSSVIVIDAARDLGHQCSRMRQPEPCSPRHSASPDELSQSRCVALQTDSRMELQWRCSCDRGSMMGSKAEHRVDHSTSSCTRHIADHRTQSRGHCASPFFVLFSFSFVFFFSLFFLFRFGCIELL